VAVKYKTNSYSMWVNGVKVNEQLTTASTLPAGTFTSMQFDSGSGSSIFYGKVRGVQAYKEALTDAELYDLTKPLHETFAVMANSLQYTTI